ncbi:hypothetical protein E2562_032786 [Oryza meyeriana var. granulata]|uniref:Uncharacterized protein n=1 Tax=Oryza meyeriana var. granulata TaxID=110450 RepID=A0A6G1DRM0_9ORYZ|nr:hypothetical protein E2562_032786 [Oryza meyeriana var. granulata]
MGDTDRRRKIRRGGDAIMAIKKKMLQCSRAKEHRRFNRSYLAGGEQGDAAASAIFYLACLAASTVPSFFSNSRMIDR